MRTAKNGMCKTIRQTLLFCYSLLTASHGGKTCVPVGLFGVSVCEWMLCVFNDGLDPPPHLTVTRPQRYPFWLFLP